MQPRLLFVSNLFPDASEPYRGLDNVTLLHELRARWDIRVISPRPTLGGWLPARGSRWAPRAGDAPMQPRFVPVRHVPKAGGMFNHLLMRADLRRVLREMRAVFPWDVMLASWLFPDGWAAQQLAAEHGTPAVLIAQGSDVHRYLRSARRRRAILEAIAGSAAVITRSQSLAGHLQDAGVAGSKLHPIHNGVDTGIFRHGSQVDARKELGITAEQKLVLFVGNLLPVKNPELLLRAYARMPLKNSSLALAGKGPLREQLEGQARTGGFSDRVRFLGPLRAESVACWMRAADVLCMSSHDEGLPNVILEAMASGLPVVATNVGGIHEIVDAPWKGTLVPAGDEAALSGALHEVLSAPPSREAIAAFGAGFSWSAAGNAYEAVLRAALNG